jgi:hypothetical protein
LPSPAFGVIAMSLQADAERVEAAAGEDEAGA